jgi:hypothetical protein
MLQGNRYLIFFVIVALGLALSWGQIGRKTRDVLRDRSVEFLVLDEDCRPAARPCAAYGAEKALVLGPDAGGSLLLKAVGIDRDAAGLSVKLLRNGVEVGEGQWRRRDAAGWRISPATEPGIQVLRIGLLAGDTTYVADFPVQ